MAIRVLAVDDEPDVLRLVEIKLRKAGFDVTTAHDGQEHRHNHQGHSHNIKVKGLRFVLSA